MDHHRQPFQQAHAGDLTVKGPAVKRGPLRFWYEGLGANPKLFYFVALDGSAGAKLQHVLLGKADCRSALAALPVSREPRRMSEDGGMHEQRD